MRVVPLADGSGTVPLRASKNPILGVFRHHCGNIATVHAPKGKKAHLRYLLCDECKCDQASGAEYQAKIKQNSFNTIEELNDFEQVGIVPSEPDSWQDENLTDTLTEQVTEQALPKSVTETAPIVVVTVTEPAKKQLEEIEPKLTEKPTVKVLPPKPPQKEVNPKNIGIAAVVGAVFGGLLALVA
mgnify:CR=1 FL=1